MAVFEEPSGLTRAEVIKYLIKKGGRSTNHELVYQFKKFLNDPLHQVEARLEFKDIVNTVAIVCEDQCVKYITLKKKYQNGNFSSCDEGPSSLNSSDGSVSQVSISSDYVSPYSQGFQPYWRYRLSSDRKLDPPAVLTGLRRLSQDWCDVSPPLAVMHARSSPNLTDTESNDNGLHRRISEEPIYQNAHSLYQNYAVDAINSLRLRTGSSQEPLSNLEDFNQAFHSSGSMTFSSSRDQHHIVCDNLQSSYSTTDSSSLLKGISKCDSLLATASVIPESNKLHNSTFEFQQHQQVTDRDIVQQHNKYLSPNIIDGPSIDICSLYTQKPCFPDAAVLACNYETPEEIYSNVPAPPPRRKESSGKENRKAQFEQKIKKLDDQKRLDEENTKDAELHQLNISSGSVKERVQKLDQLSAESIKKPSAASPVIRSRKRDRIDKIYEDDVSIASVDPKLRRQWFLKAAKCDYHCLVALLKEQPKLAGLKDISSGFTALHWAAKHGNSDVVKLIAGSYKISPNIKSHGGYTAVHIATLYKHKSVVELLIKTYGADPTIRDHSGKRADQYVDGYINRIAGMNPASSSPNKRKEFEFLAPPLLGTLRTAGLRGYDTTPRSSKPKSRASIRTTLHHSFIRRGRPQVHVKNKIV